MFRLHMFLALLRMYFTTVTVSSSGPNDVESTIIFFIPDGITRQNAIGTRWHHCEWTDRHAAMLMGFSVCGIGSFFCTHLRRHFSLSRQHYYLVSDGAGLPVLSSYWFLRLLVWESHIRRPITTHSAHSPGFPFHHLVFAWQCWPQLAHEVEDSNSDKYWLHSFACHHVK